MKPRTEEGSGQVLRVLSLGKVGSVVQATGSLGIRGTLHLRPGFRADKLPQCYNLIESYMSVHFPPRYIPKNDSLLAYSYKTLNQEFFLPERKRFAPKPKQGVTSFATPLVPKLSGKFHIAHTPRGTASPKISKPGPKPSRSPPRRSWEGISRPGATVTGATRADLNRVERACSWHKIGWWSAKCCCDCVHRGVLYVAEDGSEVVDVFHLCLRSPENTLISSGWERTLAHVPKDGDPSPNKVFPKESLSLCSAE
ncbi:uncharacterized protein LOC115072167 [Nannospalax galili]|uniref:uncharacterized protein LOC115072167 n=1 Tax=Nannospalax galili TaxID=1026970 RepID=UPI00111C869A|nr:uncharacterized protein LOC115072167 [Nannospalax galili]